MSNLVGSLRLSLQSSSQAGCLPYLPLPWQFVYCNYLPLFFFLSVLPGDPPMNGDLLCVVTEVVLWSRRPFTGPLPRQLSPPPAPFPPSLPAGSNIIPSTSRCLRLSTTESASSWRIEVVVRSVSHCSCRSKTPAMNTDQKQRGMCLDSRLFTGRDPTRRWSSQNFF